MKFIMKNFNKLYNSIIFESSFDSSLTDNQFIQTAVSKIESLYTWDDNRFKYIITKRTPIDAYVGPMNIIQKYYNEYLSKTLNIVYDTILSHIGQSIKMYYFYDPLSKYNNNREIKLAGGFYLDVEKIISLNGDLLKIKITEATYDKFKKISTNIESLNKEEMTIEDYWYSFFPVDDNINNEYREIYQKYKNLSNDERNKTEQERREKRRDHNEKMDVIRKNAKEANEKRVASFSSEFRDFASSLLHAYEFGNPTVSIESLLNYALTHKDNKDQFINDLEFYYDYIISNIEENLAYADGPAYKQDEDKIKRYKNARDKVFKVLNCSFEKGTPCYG